MSPFLKSQLQVVGGIVYYVWQEYAGPCSVYQIWTAVLDCPDNIPPPAPSLVSPDNEAVTTDNTPTFTWTSVSDPSGVTCTLQYSTNSTFGTGTITVASITNNTYAVLSALPDNTYYWRVRATDGVGNVGGWSCIWHFTVDTKSPCTYKIFVK